MHVQYTSLPAIPPLFVHPSNTEDFKLIILQYKSVICTLENTRALDTLEKLWTYYICFSALLQLWQIRREDTPDTESSRQPKGHYGVIGTKQIFMHTTSIL